MADLLKQGSDWLRDQLNSHAAGDVVYSRGVDTVSVSAVIGRTEFDAADDQGLAVLIESEDFLIRAADLVLSGSPVEPQRGDVIKRTIGGATHLYEVLPFGAAGDAQPFRFSDRHRSIYRIHTKHTGTE